VLPAVAKHSAKSAEHYTPPWIIDKARAVMGGIDLDPASNAFVNRSTVKATRLHSQEDDGLAQAWAGSVFLNPPGGRIGGKSNAGIWWAKLLHEYAVGAVTQAIFVAYSLELMQTAQPRGVLPPQAFPFCVPRTRVRYLVRDGDTLTAGDSPPNASAVVYLPRRVADDLDDETCVAAFKSIFSEQGYVAVPK
jgi:ParB family chromosome partitioning protein